MVQEEILFKIFLILSSGGLPDRCSVTFYAILKEGIMGNSHLKKKSIYGPVFQEEIFKEKKASGQAIDGLSPITMAQVS